MHYLHIHAVRIRIKALELDIDYIGTIIIMFFSTGNSHHFEMQYYFQWKMPLEKIEKVSEIIALYSMINII